MQCIYLGGYNEQERYIYREIIFFNTIQSMVYVHPILTPKEPLNFLPLSSAILEAMPQLGLSLSPENDARRSVMLGLNVQTKLSEEITDAVRGLWSDLGVKEAVRRSGEFQLNDSAPYYFNSIERISQSQYLPTDHDILRSSCKNTGISNITLKMGELRYKVLDTGGQRSERRKWIYCYENVTVLVYVASLSEYNQNLDEDKMVVCPSCLSLHFALTDALL